MQNYGVFTVIVYVVVWFFGDIDVAYHIATVAQQSVLVIPIACCFPFTFILGDNP